MCAGKVAFRKKSCSAERICKETAVLHTGTGEDPGKAGNGSINKKQTVCRKNRQQADLLLFYFWMKKGVIFVENIFGALQEENAGKYLLHLLYNPGRRCEDVRFCQNL